MHVHGTDLLWFVIGVTVLKIMMKTFRLHWRPQNNVTTNSPSQGYTHLEDHSFPIYYVTPGFKPFTENLGYVYTGPIRNRSEPNRTGPSVYTEPCGTDPDRFHVNKPNRSGTDPKLDLQNSRSSFGSVPDRFQNGPV